MSEIAGDTIRHKGMPDGMSELDVEVLIIKPCEGGDGEDKPAAYHPRYLIRDPETDDLDWVCSLDFIKVEG